MTNGEPLAVALSVRSIEGAIEDTDIAGLVGAIVASISEEFGAVLRYCSLLIDRKSNA
ncbi:hypothetical protein [Vibrio crassostreae]|uniref:hypothetical protein n=1 Tax=Vibrio crassostreae TaxID=246167 RepID=UPI001404B780|nr:hypothetical protein [Vibrio crassostreae]